MSTPPEMLPPAPADATAPSEPLLAEPFVALTHREQEQQARHAAKLARQAQVQQLHAQGWSLHAITAHTRLERKTVRKYLHIAQLPPAQARGQRRSLLDPYKPYILERWQAGCSNAMQLLREIQTQGYGGQRSILREYLTCLRKRQGLPPRSRSGGTNSSVVPPRKPPTLQTLTWLIILQADTLSAEEAADVAQARKAHPDVALATKLAQDFAALVRNRQVVADITGLTGMTIIRAILAGERDPRVLAQHRDPPPAPKRRHSPMHNQPRFDARTYLYHLTGVDLTRIDGIEAGSALALISEIGTDMTRWKSANHFVSWLGLCPGTKVSGGCYRARRSQRPHEQQ